jgi:hypothetical protein
MQFSRERTCNQFDLIVAALAPAIGLKRYGDYSVSAKLFRLARDHFGEP